MKFYLLKKTDGAGTFWYFVFMGVVEVELFS